MTQSSWRTIAAPVIANVIKRVGIEDEKALRRALREAYPFGRRERWPYKVWLSEVRSQVDCARRWAAMSPAQQAALTEALETIEGPLFFGVSQEVRP